jgi:hypothetical protein
MTLGSLFVNVPETAERFDLTKGAITIVPN